MATEIFVGYSHADAAYIGQKSSLGHLRRLKRQGASFWTDEGIRSASRGTMPSRLRSRGHRHGPREPGIPRLELRSRNDEFPALNRSRDEGLIIFPIILSKCDWKQAPWLPPATVHFDQRPHHQAALLRPAENVST